MNDNLIDLQRIWYPEKYKTTYIFTYATFDEELADMMSKSGYVEEFKRKYHKGLRFLENLKRSCIEQPRLFECLKDTDGLYSMRLSGKKNIRMLFSFEKVEDREAVIMYCCFEEKSKNDYRNAICIAQNRRKEIVSRKGDTYGK